MPHMPKSTGLINQSLPAAWEGAVQKRTAEPRCNGQAGG